MLGCVDELFNHQPHGCEMQACENALAQLVIARSHPAKLLEGVETALHFLASVVRFCRMVQGRLPVCLRGDHRGHALGVERVAPVMTVIAAVPDGLFERRFLGQWRNNGLEARGLMTLASGADERHPGRVGSRARMDVGGQSPPSASPSLGRLATGFLNAPAAGGWARTSVESRQRA